MRYDMLVVNIISTAFYGFLIVLIAEVFFKLKFDTKRIVCFTLTFAVINGTLAHFSSLFTNELGLLKTIIVAIISLALMKYVLLLDNKKSFISFGIHMVTLILGEAASYAILKTFKILDLTNILFTFSSDLSALILANLIICTISYSILLVLKLLKMNIYPLGSTKIVMVIITVGCIFTTVLMWIYIPNKEKGSNTLVLLSIIFIIFGYFMYIFYSINMSSRLEKQKLELEQQKFYNKSLDTALDNLRKFKHGYNNNLNVLYALARAGKYDRLMEYFAEVMEMNNKLNDTIALNIKNAGLYGIIASKVEYAESLNVQFKINSQSEIEDIKNVSMLDLYEIMGILLDNAIEAAAGSCEKSVNLNIIEDDECISIVTQNTYDIAPDIGRIYEKGYSSKGTGRGLGLWIIKDKLKNNKYVLNNAYIENGRFCQEILIKKG